MQTHTKIEIPKRILSNLKKSLDNHYNKQEHYNAIGISHPTYRDVMKTGFCRSDVLDKIKKYLGIELKVVK